MEDRSASLSGFLNRLTGLGIDSFAGGDGATAELIGCSSPAVNGSPDPALVGTPPLALGLAR